LPNATPPNDIVSAIISAATNKVMRFLIASHLPSLSPKGKPAYLPHGGCSRLRYWLGPSLKRPSNEAGFKAATFGLVVLSLAAPYTNEVWRCIAKEGIM
jgi:hypothetical protein